MDLITRLRALRSREHLCTVDVIEALVECDRTRAFLDHGYDTLWNFLVDGLEYSSGAASRRFKAMKVARKFPAVLDALRVRRVTLSSLEAIEPLLDAIEEEQELFDRIAGKSGVDVRQDVARARPAVKKRREIVRREYVRTEPVKAEDLFVAPVTASAVQSEPPSAGTAPVPPPAPAIEEQVTVTIRVTPEEFALIERARAIASRKPGRVPTVRETLVETARFYVAKRGAKVRTKAPAASAPGKKRTPTVRSRHIPVAVRDEVLLRDGERCTFVGHDGRRCPATLDLQIDHVLPYALGGPHEPENLRVLCGAHNRRRAE